MPVRLRALLASAGLVVAGLVPALTTTSAAQAAPAHPAGHAAPAASASGPYHICNGTCWHANGSGAQITVTNSPSNWTILSQNGYVKFQDGNGKCAYVGSSAGNPLNLGSNSCSSTYGPSSTQAFEQSCSGGSCMYTSAYSGPGGYPGRIQVFNTTSPHPVWVDVNSNLDAWITVVP